MSRIGLAAIREMSQIGILIDLSRVGDRTVLETIEHSEQPVVFTHANARSQVGHPRNKTDEAIREITAKGGVVGANAIPGHHPHGYESTLGEYLDAVDYLVQMVGVDHVAIGTDFCMGRTRAWFAWIGSSRGREPFLDAGATPEPYRHLHGFASPLEFVNVADGLLRCGYDQDATRKILGENWLRLFGPGWSSKRPRRASARSSRDGRAVASRYQCSTTGAAELCYPKPRPRCCVDCAGDHLKAASSVGRRLQVFAYDATPPYGRQRQLCGTAARKGSREARLRRAS